MKHGRFFAWAGLVACGLALLTANAATSPCPGGRMSYNVAIIDGPSVINGGSHQLFSGFNFVNLSPANVNAGNLANFDTVFLNVASPGMGCNVNTLSPTAKAALVAWLGMGNKLIIHDSECSSQNYSWLPYPFTTSNPGALGASGVSHTVEDNTLASNNPSSPYWIDDAALSNNTDAVGDANVMVTMDPNWYINMTAQNALGVTGPVHTYAEYSGDGGVNNGLMIYNGFDYDYAPYWEPPNTLTKIWYQELMQPFNPSCLRGTVTVVGINLSPASSTNPVSTTHTVTATITDQLGNPKPGILVTFQVISGPNTGAEATGVYVPSDSKTDANGQVTFTYTSNGTPGTDQIIASFFDTTRNPPATVTSRTVTKTWVQSQKPVATVVQVANAGYYRIAATSASYPPTSLAMYVADSASAFVAGPFPSGTVIRLIRSAVAGTGPGMGPASVTIRVKGTQGVVTAKDPSGAVSAPVSCRAR